MPSQTTPQVKMQVSPCQPSTGPACEHNISSSINSAAVNSKTSADPQRGTPGDSTPSTRARRSGRARVLWQCLLLAGSALAAAPALVLLDTAEQCELALMRLRHQAHNVQLHAQVGRRNMGRPLLPLWPPAMPMALAVAPAGLLLLPACQQAGLQAPVLLLCGSLVLQACINLQLAVCARMAGSHAAAEAGPAWAASASSGLGPVAAGAASLAPPGGPATGCCQQAMGHAAQPSRLAAAAVPLLARLQVVGDALRCACACCIVWRYVHAAAASSSSAAVVWHAVQQCCTGASTAHCVAAASAVARVLQQDVAALLQGLAVLAVCGASAAVYGLSLLSRCQSALAQCLQCKVA